MADQLSETEVKTGKVRFSYLYVFEPRPAKDGKAGKYAGSIIIPKSDKATLDAIKKAVDAALEKGMTKKFEGKKPTATFKWPLRDGDTDQPDDPAYENAMFLNFTSNEPPVVLKRTKDGLVPIKSAQEFYSGCFGKALLNFYPYNVDGSKGIAAGINGLFKTEEGEKLAGGRSAFSAFADEEETSEILSDDEYEI